MTGTNAEIATALADANDAALRRRIEAEVREQIAAEIEARRASMTVGWTAPVFDECIAIARGDAA
jgi:hypothetical protein